MINIFVIFKDKQIKSTFRKAKKMFYLFWCNFCHLLFIWNQRQFLSRLLIPVFIGTPCSRMPNKKSIYWNLKEHPGRIKTGKKPSSKPSLLHLVMWTAFKQDKLDSACIHAICIHITGNHRTCSHVKYAFIGPTTMKYASIGSAKLKICIRLDLQP